MSDTPPSRSSSSGEVDNSYDSSLEDLRVAFLGVKFSHKDAANLVILFKILFSNV